MLRYTGERRKKPSAFILPLPVPSRCSWFHRLLHRISPLISHCCSFCRSFAESRKEKKGGYKMGLSGDGRAEGTSSPVELGPARECQLCLPHLGCLQHFSPLLIPLCLIIGLSFHLVVDVSGAFLLYPNAYFCEHFRNVIFWRL